MNNEFMNEKSLSIFLVFVFIVCVALVLVEECDADEWEPRHVNKEILWQGLNAFDIFQSIEICDNPDQYQEKGLPRAFWGQHPSTPEMVGTMIVWGGVHIWLTDVIPKRYELFGIEWHPRDIWQDFTIGMTSTTIYLNYTIGL